MFYKFQAFWFAYGASWNLQIGWNKSCLWMWLKHRWFSNCHELWIVNYEPLLSIYFAYHYHTNIPFLTMLDYILCVYKLFSLVWMKLISMNKHDIFINCSRFKGLKGNHDKHEWSKVSPRINSQTWPNHENS
jgi:hypothetical protein